MYTQESPNRGISRRESIEKGSAPEAIATDSIGIRIDEDNSDTTEQQYVTGTKLHLIVFSLTMACFLMTLSSSVLATAIPRITSDFRSVEDIGWYGSAYLLSNCAVQPLSGKLYTYFSLKYTFLCFLAIFELGALICGLSKDSDMLIVGRAIQGCGGSGILNGALTILAAAAPISKRPILIGIIMSTASFGQVIGPLIGGALTQHASWRTALTSLGFFLNLPTGFLTALVIFLIHIPSIHNPVRTSWSSKQKFLHLDPCGFILFTPTIISFLLALEWGGSSYPWSSATIIGLFCTSFILFLLFLYWEYRLGENAMIPLDMLKKRIVNLVLSTGLVPDYQRSFAYRKRGENAADFLGDYWVFDYSGEFGYVIFSVVLFELVVRDMTDVRKFLDLDISPPGRLWAVYVQLSDLDILVGAGRGMVSQMPITAIQNSLPPTDIAIGSSLATFSGYFGSAIFLSFASTIFTNSLMKELAIYVPNINAEATIASGATGLRDLVTGTELERVLIAYNESLIRCFYLAAGGSSAAFLCSFGLGWGTVKKKNKQEGDQERVENPAKSNSPKSTAMEGKA
ncbi:putative mfs multidrug transporter protein [Botrytis fragariae]|uniref:Putative mfs multidrug transporter protein n=1 Tax=Botrytis fragariae TaxID=1964551 RepID=A0A8H6ENN4_9HELO|nr:putative mfs multidrug transporter protein [Botrytis fragariae]KAF5878853.1 putative mfs multidrug transporter protein [Botrytis fragariae]